MSTYLPYYEEEGYDKLREEQEGYSQDINFSKPQNVSKEWIKLFLSAWNRTVKLWEDGNLFTEHSKHDQYWRYNHQEPSKRQQEYARLCCIWLIPNRLAEPHVVAEGGEK